MDIGIICMGKFPNNANVKGMLSLCIMQLCLVQCVCRCVLGAPLLGCTLVTAKLALLTVLGCLRFCAEAGEHTGLPATLLCTRGWDSSHKCKMIEDCELMSCQVKQYLVIAMCQATSFKSLKAHRFSHVLALQHDGLDVHTNSHVNRHRWRMLGVVE